MNQQDKLDDIRRILIALDASPASQAALELAADLAKRYQAELIGIYVEDINLIRTAEIPFSREIGFYTRAQHRIDSRRIESELRAHAQRVEQLLASIASRANLRWTFRRARGLIPRELLAAAEDTDLIILGKKGWSGGTQVGSTAREVAERSPIQSLILERKIRPGTPVLVIYDGSPDSWRALDTAKRICTPGSTLTILVPADNQQAAEQLHSDLSAWINAQDLQIKFRWTKDLQGDRISHLALISGCDLVILPAQSEHFLPGTIIRMLEKADCAVLLVR